MRDLELFWVFWDVGDMQRHFRDHANRLRKVPGPCSPVPAAKGNRPSQILVADFLSTSLNTNYLALSARIFQTSIVVVVFISFCSGGHRLASLSV